MSFSPSIHEEPKACYTIRLQYSRFAHRWSANITIPGEYERDLRDFKAALSGMAALNMFDTKFFARRAARKAVRFHKKHPDMFTWQPSSEVEKYCP